MKTIEECSTRRLLLQRMRPTDLDELVQMYRDPVVMATLGGVRSAAQTGDYLERQLAHWNEHGFGWWTARDRSTGRFAGRGGLRHNTVDGRDEVEVGYGFLAEFWGRGLATELAVASVRVGFADLELPDLVCFTLPTNAASRRVIKKAGFRYERDIVYADLPHLLCRQTRAQWRQGNDFPQLRS